MLKKLINWSLFFSTLAPLLLSVLASSSVMGQSAPTLEIQYIAREIAPSNKDPNQQTYRTLEIWEYLPSDDVMKALISALNAENPALMAATAEEILAGETKNGIKIGDHSRYIISDSERPSGLESWRPIDVGSGTTPVRVSMASAVRVLLPGKPNEPTRYILLVNRSNASQGQIKLGPIGGAYEVNEEAWERAKQLVDDEVEMEKGPNELRFTAPAYQIAILESIAGEFKELSPLREIVEELGVESGVVTPQVLANEASSMTIVTDFAVKQPPPTAAEVENMTAYCESVLKSITKDY